MQDLKPQPKELVLTLNTENLAPDQLRLLKIMTSLMTQVLTAEDESEYFELSADLIKKAAELIKHADFPRHQKGINYGTQAVEFAMDFLNESLEQNKLNNLDN